MGRKKYLIWYLIIVNILFFGLAITHLVIDVMQSRDPTESSAYNKAIGAGSSKYQAYLLFPISCFKILSAMCGITGAAMRNKWLLMFSALFLVVDIVGRILLIVLLSVASISSRKMIGNEFRRSFPMYGNRTDRRADDFTVEVDSYMTHFPCCGWSDTKDENLYINSTWYRTLNSTTFLHPKCCSSKAIQEKLVDSCLKERDMQKARRDGFIHASNCLDLVMTKKNLYLYGSISVHLLVIILSVIAVYALREVSLDASNNPDIKSDDSY